VNSTHGSGNTAVGYGALSVNTTGENNIGIGAVAGSNITTASNVICIGANVPGANVSNSCFIGNIRGITTQNGDAIPVLIDSDGQLGTMSSSRRYKTDIEPMDKASESILALKPVSFHYTVNKDKTPQFGLIAEEVARVNPNLVARDKNGEIYTVRYDSVNAMLLNEFLKEHHRVEQLEATVANLAATVQKQAVQLQNVSAQIGVNKPGAKVVSANP
jgi:endosialidase-like protein